MITDKLELVAKTGCVLSYQRIIETEEDKNPRLSNGQTLLHLVVKYGHEKLCEAIIDNLLDQDENCFDFLDTYTSEDEVLSMHYRNLERKVPRDFRDQTPLHIAAIHGHYNIFKLFIFNLLDNTSWLWAQLDDRKWTPLHHAALMGNAQICKLILDNFEDHKPTHYVDEEFQCPLHVAAYRGHFQICKLLIDRNSPMDLKVICFQRKTVEKVDCM